MITLARLSSVRMLRGMSETKANDTEQRLTDVETRLATLEQRNAGIASIERELIEAAEQYGRCISLCFYVEQTPNGPRRITFDNYSKTTRAETFLLKIQSLARDLIEAKTML